MGAVVIIATIVEGHDARQQVVVGEDNFYGLRFGDGGPRPAPNLATYVCSTKNFGKIFSLG